MMLDLATVILVAVAFYWLGRQHGARTASRDERAIMQAMNQAMIANHTHILRSARDERKG